MSLRAADFSKLMSSPRRPGGRLHTIACADDPWGTCRLPDLSTYAPRKTRSFPTEFSCGDSSPFKKATDDALALVLRSVSLLPRTPACMWVLTAFSGRLVVTDRGGYGAGELKREELFDDAPFPLLPARAVLPPARRCCDQESYQAWTTRSKQLSVTPRRRLWFSPK